MELTQERLNRLLTYVPETGELFWRARTTEDFEDGKHSAERKRAAWNARYAGVRAFTVKNNDGYNTGTLYDKKYKASRVIWKMLHGVWPNEIDHKDRDRANDRIANLRDSDRVGNLLNRGRFKGAKRKHRNIDLQRVGWVVQIRQDGTSRYVGTYSTETEAITARDEWCIGNDLPVNDSHGIEGWGGGNAPRHG